jgi:excisionase family DNA binding protein
LVTDHYEIKITDDDNTGKDLLRIQEVSNLLNVCGNTLRKWSDLGIIKTYRTGIRSERRFRREDVFALITKERADSYQSDPTYSSRR